MKTHIVIALDKSGSMLKVKDATIRGFNSWLAETSAKSSPDTRCTLILFNHDVETTPICDVPIADVAPLDDTRYFCRGNTSLHDTLAETIHSTQDRVKPEDRVLVVVVTDGRDTSSKEYSADNVRVLIREKEDQGNWTFVYLSSDPRSFQDSRAMGMTAGNTQSYTHDAYARGQTWGDLGARTQTYMANTATGGTDRFWGEPIPATGVTNGPADQERVVMGEFMRIPGMPPPPLGPPMPRIPRRNPLGPTLMGGRGPGPGIVTVDASDWVGENWFDTRWPTPIPAPGEDDQ